MSNDMHNPNLPDAGNGGHVPDKFDAHHRQQLSALIDGELSTEEARFMLRRLEHDDALAGCHERWQLLGDVLRGQACAPAPVDFAARVHAAVAAEPASQALPATATRERRSWGRWGGSAALAASVAAVALFMTREQLPDQGPAEPPMTVIASQAELPPATGSAPAQGTPSRPAVVADAALAVAAVPAAAVAARRSSSATRNQQAARSVAARSVEPQRAVASQAPLAPTVPAGATRELPFGNVSGLQAKPWPRSTLGGEGALNASFSTEPQAAFYPFEPRLQEADPAALPPRRGRD